MLSTQFITTFTAGACRPSGETCPSSGAGSRPSPGCRTSRSRAHSCGIPPSRLGRPQRAVRGSRPRTARDAPRPGRLRAAAACMQPRQLSTRPCTTEGLQIPCDHAKELDRSSRPARLDLPVSHFLQIHTPWTTAEQAMAHACRGTPPYLVLNTKSFQSTRLRTKCCWSPRIASSMRRS